MGSDGMLPMNPHFSGVGDATKLTWRALGRTWHCWWQLSPMNSAFALRDPCTHIGMGTLVSSKRWKSSTRTWDFCLHPPALPRGGPVGRLRAGGTQKPGFCVQLSGSRAFAGRMMPSLPVCSDQSGCGWGDQDSSEVLPPCPGAAGGVSPSQPFGDSWLSGSLSG